MGSGEDKHGLIFYAAGISGLHLHEQRGFRNFTKQPTEMLALRGYGEISTTPDAKTPASHVLMFPLLNTIPHPICLMVICDELNRRKRSGGWFGTLALCFVSVSDRAFLWPRGNRGAKEAVD